MVVTRGDLAVRVDLLRPQRFTGGERQCRQERNARLGHRRVRRDQRLRRDFRAFVARQREGEELSQWSGVKEAASRAIVEGGGTITHHHAVGRDHAPWMAAEVGERGCAALRALKAELDPAGIMNPGKLIA